MEALPGKSFYSNYFILNPKQATLVDLFSLLFSSNLKNRKFIETSYVKLEKDFGYRIILFFCTMSLKVLQAIANPLAWFGAALEDFLNLLQSNGGLLGLIKNIMTGKVKIPDREAATYLSFIGLTDVRMDLDSKILFGDSMYNPALSMMACKAVYNNEAYTQDTVGSHWKMEHLGFNNYWNDSLLKADTQAFLFRDKADDHDTVVVCFRGTELFNADDWYSDFDCSWYEFPNIGKIHSGFLKALGMQKNVGWPKQVMPYPTRQAPLAYYDIRDKLKDLLKENPQAKIIVTGHSLGGALAILFPVILMYHEETLLLDRLEGIYTFGQPRVGDEAFGTYMVKNLSKNNIQYYRYAYCDDLVPRIPFESMSFKHFGTCVYYNSNYEAEIVDEVPYSNYFSMWAIFPMLKSAIYELIRSFTIADERGPDYKETWLLVCIRMIGMMVPGVPDHFPQDYVNSTRLGSPDDASTYPRHNKPYSIINQTVLPN